jgi:hypothetical protein
LLFSDEIIVSFLPALLVIGIVCQIVPYPFFLLLDEGIIFKIFRTFFFYRRKFLKGAYLLFLLQDSGQGKELVKGEGCFKCFFLFRALKCSLTRMTKLRRWGEFFPQYFPSPFFIQFSVADPGSGAFLTPGSGIRDG